MTCLRSCGELEAKLEIGASALSLWDSVWSPGKKCEYTWTVRSEPDALVAGSGFCRGLQDGAPSAPRTLDLGHQEPLREGRLWD